MKKYILFIFSSVLIVTLANSQELRKSGPIGFPIYESSIDGATFNELTPISGPSEAKFYVLGDSKKDAGFVLIRYLNWYRQPTSTSDLAPFDVRKFSDFNFRIADRTTVQKNIPLAIAESLERKYFVVRKKDIENLSAPYYVANLKSSTFSLGFITMPVKMRLKDFDFTDQFSLGATAGIKWRISNRSDNFFHALIGVNVGVVDIDSTNSKPTLDIVKKNFPAKNVGVLSPAIGLVLSFGEAQVGLFFGQDYLGKSNREKYNWIYNKKIWMSFGVGFNLFSADKKTKTPAKKEQDEN